MKRTTSPKTVTKPRRTWRIETVTRTVMQCEPAYVQFGANLRRCRHKIGMTQHDLAAITNQGRASIANIETGRQRVLLGDVFVYAKALRCRPKDLLTGILP